MSGGAVLAACDMFPLGLIAFELFTSFGSAMERAKAFGELRARRVPSDFTQRYTLLASLVGQLLAESPSERPTCTALLQAVRPGPASPVVSPLTSPVLSTSSPVGPLPQQASLADEIPSAILPAPAATTIAVPVPTAGAPSAVPLHAAESSSSNETSGGSAVDASAEGEVPANGAPADGVAADGGDGGMEDAGGGAADWRDEELTRRLLEMGVLAAELQRVEAAGGASSPPAAAATS